MCTDLSLEGYCLNPYQPGSFPRGRKHPACRPYKNHEIIWFGSAKASADRTQNSVNLYSRLIFKLLILCDP